jgi:hypothetical protein
MGIGDAIMAAGEARVLYEQQKLPVLITGIDGRPRWSEVYEGNPYLIKWNQRARRHVRMVNGPHARPYIAGKTAKQWEWKPYRPKLAEVFLTDTEKAFAEPYRGLIMIEPNGKAIGHNNKLWLWDRWEQLVQGSTLKFVQCNYGPGGGLLGVTNVVTPTFRHAMAVLSVARAFVGIEGGLMHAAAALGVPSVILWSEFISPEITGYSHFKNLRHAGKPCGMRVDCAGCRRSMEAITVLEVAHALGSLL